jgi:hypothetical protein
METVRAIQSEGGTGYNGRELDNCEGHDGVDDRDRMEKSVKNIIILQ